MSGTQFSKTVAFVKEVVSFFDLKKNRFGVMEYSHYYASKTMKNQRYLRTEIEIGKFNNHLEFNNQADTIMHQGYTTYTAHAIKKAVEVDFPSNVERFVDPCVRKVIVVVTDGKASDTRSVRNEAEIARQRFFTLFAVGVRRARTQELQQIANGINNDERVYVANSFNALPSLVKPLRDDLFHVLNEIEKISK